VFSGHEGDLCYGLCGFGPGASTEYYGGRCGIGNDVAPYRVMTEAFLNPLAEFVWRARYRGDRSAGVPELTAADTMARVSRALATPERDTAGWQRRFAAILDGFRFLPGGRILAAAGASSGTMLNCFVMGPLRDDPEQLLAALAEGARTLQQGGGVGWDFSTLRSRGAGSDRPLGPGPVACLELWDAACRVFTAGTGRGGAMMGALAVSHPDIEAFVLAKARPGALEHFNLSVQLDDGFLAESGTDAGRPPPRPAWEPSAEAAGVRGSAAAGALTLRQLILDSMLEWSEPGVLFVDAINRENNLWWCERLATTNPCGEAPLPPYGACDLGSINLTGLVLRPFGRDAQLDLEALAQTARVAVRMLDNVLDLTSYPLARQRQEAMRTRRIGLGITGLGDALAMLGLRYDSEAGRRAATAAMEKLKLAAYEASLELAREKGAFPAFDRDRYLAGSFVARLPDAIRDRISRCGIRNSHLLAIAPTGSISLLAGNVSPGIEPIPALRQRRRVLDADGQLRQFEVDDRAWSLFRQGAGKAPAAFVIAPDVSPAAQLDMQIALQPHVDGAISKTLLLPATCTASELDQLLTRAHQGGLKGFAVHRRASARDREGGAGCVRAAGGRIECDAP
jgi:ribonucleoside-diphosphate reductase alpha chain